MSVATKKELEEIIATMWSDLNRIHANLREEHEGGDSILEDFYIDGYIDAVKAARDLIGVAVKTYRIEIEDES